MLVIEQGGRAWRVCWSRVPSAAPPVPPMTSANPDHITLPPAHNSLPSIEMDAAFAAALGVAPGSVVRGNGIHMTHVEGLSKPLVRISTSNTSLQVRVSVARDTPRCRHVAVRPASAAESNIIVRRQNVSIPC